MGTKIPSAAVSGAQDFLATKLARAQSLLPASGLTMALGTLFESDAWYGTSLVSSGTAALSTADKGGVVTASTGATAGGTAIVLPHGAPSWIDNAHTSPWYSYFSFELTTAVDAQALLLLELAAISAGAPANPAVRFGVNGALSATNYSFLVTNSGGSTTASGTGAAVDTNTWHAAEMYSDGTTVTFLFDGASVGNTATSNVGASPMMPVVAALNGTTAAARTIKVDSIAVCIVGNI